MALITEKPDDLEPRPTIHAAKVKIVGGMSEFALEDPPDVGEKRTYIVETFCKKHHFDKVDGERRLVCDMEQTTIYEKGKVPIVDEAKPTLYDDQPALFDDATDADGGDEDSEGVDDAEDDPDLPPDEAIVSDEPTDFGKPLHAVPEQRLDGHGPKLFSAVD